MSENQQSYPELTSIAAVAYKDGVTTFAVGMRLGEDYVADAEIRNGDAYKLMGALTRKRPLEPGDRIVEFGVNGSETAYGKVLKQSEDGCVAWETDDYGVRISERTRLVRLEEG